MPKVSIIVPLYNSEAYLDECLASAEAQTLKDIEILCIDDGSTDSSPAILQKHQALDSRIRILTKPNSGYGNSMNLGIENATGEYIGILESDDYVDPEAYERYYSLAKEFDNLDFVRSDFMRFYGEGETRTFEPIHFIWKEAYYNRVVNPSEDYGLFKGNNLTQPGIYRRQFLLDQHIRYNETPGASYQDNGFWFQVFMLAKKAYFTHETHYMIRRDNPNSSVKSRDKVFCMCDEYNYIRDFILSRPELGHEALAVCSRARFDNYVWTLERIAPEHRMPFLRRFSSDFRFLEANGELERFQFRNDQWELLESIMLNPIRYERSSKRTRSLNKDIRQQRKNTAAAYHEIDNIKASASFRIGQALTLLPRIIRSKIKAFRSKTASESGAIKTIRPNPRQERFMMMNPAQYVEELMDWYTVKTGDIFDLDHPISFNQKIQWLKIYDCQPIKTILADKYLAREWIADKIGAEYLIPLLGVWDDFDSIDFDSLPDKFVLKTNHGSGWNAVVTDKSQFDKVAYKQKFDKWMTSNFGFETGFELQYRDIEPKILAEQFLDNGDNELFDYRFFCFNGEPRSVWVDVGSGTQNHRRDLYDMSWQLMPILVNYPNLPERKPCPQNFELMKRLARTLSEGFALVRVDFYEVDGKVYFGEMTFTPQSGIGRWDPPIANKIFGDMIELPERIEFHPRSDY